MGVSSQGCILFSVQKDCWLWVIKLAEMYAYQILTNSWLVDSAPVTLNLWTIKVWHRSIKETTMGQWRSAFRWSCGRFPVWPQLSFPTVAVTHQKFIDIIWIIVFKDRLCQCFSDRPIYLLTWVVRAICQHTYLPWAVRLQPPFLPVHVTKVKSLWPSLQNHSGVSTFSTFPRITSETVAGNAQELTVTILNRPLAILVVAFLGSCASDCTVCYAEEFQGSLWL